MFYPINLAGCRPIFIPNGVNIFYMEEGPCAELYVYITTVFATYVVLATVSVLDVTTYILIQRRLKVNSTPVKMALRDPWKFRAILFFCLGLSKMSVSALFLRWQFCSMALFCFLFSRIYNFAYIPKF